MEKLKKMYVTAEEVHAVKRNRNKGHIKVQNEL